MKKRLSLKLLPLTLLISGTSLSAYSSEKAFDLRIETKVSYRNSDENHYSTPLSSAAGAPFEHQTVNAGGHFDFSNLAVFTKWQMTEAWQLVGKIDLIDLYERNPTSSDKKADIDNLFIRYGTKYTNSNLPESVDFYGQFGKFGKFERQEDRHLESYGLVSTAFNRLEDSGFEFGVDLPIGFYAKLSYTTGNPLFYRDPNALAGDHGVKDVAKNFHAGMPILYDAEVEDIDLSDNPETGGALGYRWLNAKGNMRLNLMAFSYQRDMADTMELHGTLYGAELDLLAVTPAEVPLPGPAGLAYKSNSKKESGLNIWWYQDNLAVFVQYVTQNAAELKRVGKEIEVSYAFNKVGNILAISPVIRYSKLEPDFVADALYPAQSVAWEWEKIDLGVNVDFDKFTRITFEHAENNFIRKDVNRDNDEVLVTLRVRYDI